MDGLKLEIADGIRMFKLQSTKEAIILARRRDDQITSQRVRPITNRTPLPVTSLVPPLSLTPALVKHLSWDEM